MAAEKRGAIRVTPTEWLRQRRVSRRISDPNHAEVPSACVWVKTAHQAANQDSGERGEEIDYSPFTPYPYHPKKL